MAVQICTWPLWETTIVGSGHFGSGHFGNGHYEKRPVWNLAICGTAIVERPLWNTAMSEQPFWNWPLCEMANLEHSHFGSGHFEMIHYGKRPIWNTEILGIAILGTVHF